MIINDRVYGKVKIDSPVLIELIKSKPIQRLKKINQFGIPDEYYFVKNISRYEHSVGVMILLKSLGAKEDEQIAGLLHDVSHTAFSHIIDWVVEEGGGKEDYQDNQHKNFVKNKDLSSILKKYKYKPASVFSYKHFGLLERELPELCADRVDYCLREFSQKRRHELFKTLLSKNGKIVFSNRNSAYLFAMGFLDRQENHWGGFEANARWNIFSKLLNYSLNKKIIKFNDFWKYDDYIIRKLKKSKDKNVLNILSILRNKSLKTFALGKDSQARKFRRVDPLFLENGNLLRLSDVDNKFKIELERARKRNLTGTLLPKFTNYFKELELD